MQKPDALIREIADALEKAQNGYEKLIQYYERFLTIEHRPLRQRLLEIDRSDLSPEEKADQIAEGMRLFTLLCRFDDQRNHVSELQDDLSLLREAEKVPTSDVPYWRDAFHQNLAAILVADGLGYDAW